MALVMKGEVDDDAVVARLGAGEGQTGRAGQEVGVQVRVGGDRDPQPTPHGGCPHRPQVSRHIDRQRPAIPQLHQVGRVPRPSSTTGTSTAPVTADLPSSSSPGGHGQPGSLPLGEPVGQPPCPEPVAGQFPDRIVGVHAVGAAAVGHHLGIGG